MGKRETEQALLAEKRVYDDSPQVTVTYKDLSRLIEHIIDLQEERTVNGFKGDK